MTKNINNNNNNNTELFDKVKKIGLNPDVRRILRKHGNSSVKIHGKYMAVIDAMCYYNDTFWRVENDYIAMIFDEDRGHKIREKHPNDKDGVFVNKSYYNCVWWCGGGEYKEGEEEYDDK